MPMRSTPILDGAGRVIGIACHRERRARCQTAGCRGDARLLCDYPVQRRGKATTCNRHICRGCAKAIDATHDYCPPHARTWALGAPEREERAKLAAILAEFTPCAVAEDEVEK